MAYYVEVDEIDPELADLPIDLPYDHRTVHGPVNEVGETRADYVGQIILHLLRATHRDLRQKERKRKEEKKIKKIEHDTPGTK